MSDEIEELLLRIGGTTVLTAATMCSMFAVSDGLLGLCALLFGAWANTLHHADKRRG